MPTFVNGASNGTGGSTTLSCNVPASVADGDLLLAWVSVASQDGRPSTPSGWTALDWRDPGNGGGGFLFARMASSEPASYTWTLSISSAFAVITHAYRPSSGSWSNLADAIAIFRVHDDTASNGTQDVAALDVGGNLDMMLVAFMALGRGSTTTTAPSGYTMAQNPDTGGTTAGSTEAAGAYKSVTGGTAPATSFSTSNGAIAATAHVAIIDPGTTLPRAIRAFKFGSTVATGITLTTPFCGVGDLLVAFVAESDRSASITANGDWTQLLALGGANTGTDKMAVYYRIADGTEDATYSWSVGTSQAWSGAIVVLTDTPGAVGSIADDTSQDTTWNVPALTMAAASPYAIVLAAAAPERGDRTISAWPSGYTGLVFTRSGSLSTSSLLAIAYKNETGADPGSTSFTGSGSARNIGARVGRLSAGGTARAWAYVLGG